MNSFFKIALVCSGLVITGSAYSAVAQFENEKATCYIFNNDKLTKKVNCTYDGYDGSVIHEHTSNSFAQYDFKIPGSKKITIDTGVEVINSDGSEDELRVIDEYTKMNNKKAIEKYRNTSLKIISAKQAEQNWENVLKCYKQSNTEFCFIDR